MDRFPQMLYRAGGVEVMHGARFSTLIVEDDEALASALANGWHETTPAALDAVKASEEPRDDAPPTRAELEQKALELDIRLDGRWSDKRLADEIAKKLAAS